MVPVPPPPTVISTETEQSGVEWSGEISGPNGTGPIAVGDLGAQSINGVQMPLSSYRHAAPLEMTCWRAAHSHGEQKQMTQIPHPPTCHFDRNRAKRSGEISGPNGTSASPAPLSFRPQRSVVEKSPDSVGQAPMRWEISRLRVSMIYKYLYPHTDTQPRSR